MIKLRNQLGLATAIIILIVVILVIAGGIGYYFYKEKKEIKEEVSIESSLEPYADKIITITGRFYSDDKWQYIQIKDESRYAIQTHPVLIFEADLSNFKKEDRSESVEGLRDLIERRVSAIGVEKTIVQVVEENKIVVEPIISPLRIKENFIDELIKMICKVPINTDVMPVPIKFVSHQNKVDIEDLQKLQGKIISVKGYLIGKNLIDVISFEIE